MRLLFVINPTSGRTSNQQAAEYIQSWNSRDDLEVRLYSTAGKDDEAGIRREIAAFSPDRVAACGGDGTVQLVARTLIGKPIPLGIVPLGSANGLAKALAIPRDYQEAVDLIVNSKQIIPLDLLNINDEYLCTHLSDVGTNAILVKNFEEAGDKGMIGYAKHLIPSIQQSDLMHYVIETPQGTFSKTGYMLVIANAHKYGTGVQISEGSVSDGRFEICTIQRIDLESIVKAGLTALNVFIDKEMFSDVISCTSASIQIHPRGHLQIDGEYIGEMDHLRVRIVSSAVNVVVPA